MQLNVGLVVAESDVLSKLVEQHKSDCKAMSSQRDPMPITNSLVLVHCKARVP